MKVLSWCQTRIRTLQHFGVGGHGRHNPGRSKRGVDRQLSSCRGKTGGRVGACGVVVIEERS